MIPQEFMLRDISNNTRELVTRLNSWEATGRTVDDSIALCLHEANSANQLVDGINSFLGSRKERCSRISYRVAAFLENQK
jgi:hypothetical protein